jgi:glycosyltransferase involved in cell wall biosynthesis
MRICHVLTNEHGGGRVYAEALARGAAARGDEVEWLFAGTRHVYARGARRAYAHADVIHCHGFRAALVVAPFSAGLVVTPHGSHLIRRTHGPRRDVALACVRAATHRARVVICVGQDEFGDLQSVLGSQASKLRLILNGSKRVPPPSLEQRLAARRELGIDGDAPVIAFIARLEPHKDPVLAIRAFEHARSLLPSARLIVAGEGSLAEPMRALGLPGVHFLGQVPDVHPVLVAADAVLNTSHWEGMSLSLLEALWCGRPAVAVAAAGNREAIADTGLLVDARDPHEIGAAIARLLGDRGRLDALGARARSRAERLFDEERMVEETLRLYEQVGRRTARGTGRREPVRVGAR